MRKVAWLRRLLPLTGAATLLFVPAATAAPHADVVGGTLEIVATDGGGHVRLIDHGPDGTEVVWNTDNEVVPGCSPACTGFTSIHFTGTSESDMFSGDGARVPIVAKGLGGADTLVGGPEADTLHGGDGDDLLLDGNGSPDGADLFDGGPGTDTVSYSGSFYDHALPRSAPVSIRLAPPGATSANNGAAAEDDQILDVENARGASGDDTLVGNDDGNQLDGGPGADIVFGGGGPNTIEARDATADTVDCGASGGDVVRSDIGLDQVDACEGVMPQVFGIPTMTGSFVYGELLTASGVTVQGTPTPTLTYTWEGCGHYDCGLPVAEGPTWAPTDVLVQYPLYGGLVLEATATNAYGSDAVASERAFINRRPDAFPSPPGTDAPYRTAPTPTFHPLDAARAVLGSRPVRLAALGPDVILYRTAGPLVLRTARAIVAATCAGPTTCWITIHPALALKPHGKRRTRRLATRRLAVPARSAAVLRLALPASVRTQLRHAKRGTLRLTLSSGTARRAVSLAVR